MDRVIGFIGGGQMAKALVGGILTAGLTIPERVIVSDVNPVCREQLQSEYGIHTVDDNATVLKSSDIILLAVKPQVAEEVLEPLANSWRKNLLVVSIVTGWTINKLRSLIGDQPSLVRVVPNTPCLIGEGVSAYAAGKEATSDELALVDSIFSSVGRTVKLPEEQMDAVTGLSGSGPAYVFLILEALSDAGVRVGLPRDVATILATQTMVGASRMTASSGIHPAILREQVTSPGGTTIRGLHVLESAKVRGAFMDAVVAATERARDLGGE